MSVVGVGAVIERKKPLPKAAAVPLSRKKIYGLIDSFLLLI